MTPKEKAKKLVDKYYQLAESIEWTDKETMQKAELLNDELGEDVLFYWHELAKQCTLIAVNEIIKSKQLNYLFTQEQIYLMEGTSDDRWIHETFMKYWKQVKHEIEKL
jgi:hypothetical protein